MKSAIKQNILKIHGRDPADLDELAQCVINVINCYEDRSRQKVVKPKVVGFSWDLLHGNSISNTHACPIDGVSNWGCDPKKPRGYPGWTGRVWIRYDKPAVSFGSDPFRITCTYPGTGGWGGYNGPWETLYNAWYTRYRGYKKPPRDAYPEPQIYSWDYRFFDADWPDLEQMRMWDILSDRDGRDHKFLWEDPLVKMADVNFMVEQKIKCLDNEQEVK